MKIEQARGRLGITRYRNLRTQLVRLQDALANAQSRSPRFAQEHAGRVLAPLYGYHFQAVTYHYTIYRNGRTKCTATLEFLSDGRAIGRWHRLRFLDPENPMSPPQTEPAGFLLKTSPAPEYKNGFVDEFIFQPNLSETNPVKFKIIDDYPSGMLTDLTAKGGERHDHVGVSLRAPADLLVIIVEFDGFKPVEFDCKAVHGPGKDPLGFEAADAERQLRDDPGGNNFSIKLRLPHPMIGVDYRVGYTVKSAKESAGQDEKDSNYSR